MADARWVRRTVEKTLVIVGIHGLAEAVLVYKSDQRPVSQKDEKRVSKYQTME